MLLHEFTCCHLTNRLLPGGNIVLADNGPMFKEMYAAQASVLPMQKCNNQRMLTAELKAAGQNCKIAYIDPSYMVRSVAADTKDSHMCYLLASQVCAATRIPNLIIFEGIFSFKFKRVFCRLCMASCTGLRSLGSVVVALAASPFYFLQPKFGFLTLNAACAW